MATFTDIDTDTDHAAEREGGRARKRQRERHAERMRGMHARESLISSCQTSPKHVRSHLPKRPAGKGLFCIDVSQACVPRMCCSANWINSTLLMKYE